MEKGEMKLGKETPHKELQEKSSLSPLTVIHAGKRTRRRRKKKKPLLHPKQQIGLELHGFVEEKRDETQWRKLFGEGGPNGEV